MDSKALRSRFAEAGHASAISCQALRTLEAVGVQEGRPTHVLAFRDGQPDCFPCQFNFRHHPPQNPALCITRLARSAMGPDFPTPWIRSRRLTFPSGASQSSLVIPKVGLQAILRRAQSDGGRGHTQVTP